MNRKLFSLVGVFTAVFGLAGMSQVADAQVYASGGCCNQGSYSGYGQVGGYGYSGSVGGYGYGSSMSGCGCGPTSGYGSAMMGYASYPSSGYCGVPSCGSGGYGMSGVCGTRCGLVRNWGNRFSSGCCDSPCGPSTYAMYGGYGGMSGGYGIGGCNTGCNTGCKRIWSLGCRTRRCYPQTSNGCCQLSCGFTGAAAACCTPVPSTCCGATVGSYPIQPGYAAPSPSAVAPSPTVVSPSPTPAPAHAPEPIPSPPAEPTTKDAPEPEKKDEAKPEAKSDAEAKADSKPELKAEPELAPEPKPGT